jgi:hypothetical protein
MNFDRHSILLAAHSLRSFDARRQYPADVAGYYSRCPSGKIKTSDLSQP